MFMHVKAYLGNVLLLLFLPFWGEGGGSSLGAALWPSVFLKHMAYTL